jgi:hypothetical protein
MPIPLLLGGSKAAFNAARAANDTFVAPPAGNAVRTQSAPNFANAMQAAATKSTTGAKTVNQADAQKAQNALNAFHQTLLKLMADGQVDTSQPIQLQSDGLGGVQVAGNNPDADKITAILNDHPELVAQFQALAQSYGQLRAADPTLAAADTLHPPVFGITINGQQAQATFS